MLPPCKSIATPVAPPRKQRVCPMLPHVNQPPGGVRVKSPGIQSGAAVSPFGGFKHEALPQIADAPPNELGKASPLVIR